MRGCDVDDVYVRIVDELVVRSVGLGTAGDGELGDKLLRAAGRRRTCDCGDGVGYVRGVAGGGVFEEVFYEGCMYLSMCSVCGRGV